jgi:hypothetical protein
MRSRIDHPHLVVPDHGAFKSGGVIAKDDHNRLKPAGVGQVERELEDRCPVQLRQQLLAAEALARTRGQNERGCY